MRLQVSIRRHALPMINIIFTTGTGPSSKTLTLTATITDLLHDINDLVPLESADGEWGLEDYVVEVQATAHQDAYYECLHFQPIDSVLREDDEVVIRSLGIEDLRSRRLGGRHQISGDGRHLIDGVAFGRQWLRKGGRPAINIPPRKRRKLEIEGDQESLDEQSTTLLEQIKQDIDEDDEDDDDFVDEADDDESVELPSEYDDDEPMRIKATADFDDADVDEEEDSNEGSNDEDYEIMAETGLELSDEFKALLVEAEQLSENDTYYRLPSEAAQSPRKRKRDVEDDQGSEAVTDFEGFPTPTKPLENPFSPVSSVSPASTSDDTTIPSESDSDSDSEDDVAGPIDTSSSGSSDSEHTDSSEDTSDSDSDDDSSSSDSSSDSSSEGDMKPEEKKLPSSSPARQASSPAHPTSTSGASIPHPISLNKRVQGVPGEGLKATHLNNLRQKKRQRLSQLKQDGLLPPNANFADMVALEEQTKNEENIEGEVQLELDNAIQSKKAALLQQLQAGEEGPATSNMPRQVENDSSFVGAIRQDQATNTEDITINKDAADGQLEPDINADAAVKDSKTHNENATMDEEMDVDESVPSQEIGARAQESLIGKATPKLTEKRAKLDLASSRRMLFNSLGLRTPKTPAAEQALREKLAKDIRKPALRESEERTNDGSQIEGPAEDNMDSWKEKLVLSAVECDIEGVKLSTPPFPFKQGWDSNANIRRDANKKKGRKRSKCHDGSEDYVAQYAPDVSTLQDRSEATPPAKDDRPESRTLSLEEQIADDMPRPSDFQNLSNLAKGDLAPGAVITFRELDIQNFQPMVSAYRVARVRNVQIEESSEVIELMLSKEDWPTGRRGSDPFAIEDENQQPEDGIRFKQFTDLIEPKLVEASSVLFNATPADLAQEPTEENASDNAPQAQSSAMPDSEKAVQNSIESAQPKSKVLAMSHVEVNTPRRNQITAIVEEAGFDSAIDLELLPPEVEVEPQSSPAFHTRSHGSMRSSRSPAPINIHTTSASTKRPRFNSPGLNGWDSNPLRSEHADVKMYAPPEGSQQPIPEAPRAEIQSSIPYPTLSQLELDASGVTVTYDSSFQDAQRISQPLDTDTSVLQPDLDTSKLQPGYPYDDFGPDETQASLASEVPQTQSQSLPASSQPAAKDTNRKKSFLGHGLDGQASSDEASDFNSDTSIPNMHELTSSQNYKIRQASRRARVSPPTSRAPNFSISPPPIKGKRLRNGKKRSASPESDDGVEPPPVMMSQSQPPRFGKIPPGSQIMDLTLSSSPRKENDEKYQAPKTRGAKVKTKVRAPAARGKSVKSFSSEDDDGDGTGLGKKRFLTMKRWK